MHGVSSLLCIDSNSNNTCAGITQNNVTEYVEKNLMIEERQMIENVKVCSPHLYFLTNCRAWLHPNPVH